VAWQTLWAILAALVVAWGHPALCASLAPFAAVAGFALFWQQLERTESQQRRFWLASLWFGAIQLVQNRWLVSLEYQGLYILALYLLISIAIGLQFGLLTFFLRRPLLMAAAWVVLERIRLLPLCGWSWNPVGMSLATYSLPMASLVGAYGLSFWVIWTNATLLQAWRTKAAQAWSAWALLALLPVAFTWIYPTPAGGTTRRVWLVQTGLTPAQKQPLPGREQEAIPLLTQWRHLIRLLPNDGWPDLIVLPEATIPGSEERAIYHSDDLASLSLPASCRSNGAIAQLLADRSGAMLVAGFDTHLGAGDVRASAFCYGKMAPQRYDKRVLLPAAEYLPKWLTPIARWYGIQEGFTAGESAGLFEGPLRVAPLICYEETMGHLVRESAQLRPDLLVNLTNDGWYPSTRLPLHHLWHSRLRCAELGLPLVRACHTGITAGFDCRGNVIGMLGNDPKQWENLAGVLTLDMPLDQIVTPFRRFGEAPLLILCLTLLCLEGLRVARSKRVFALLKIKIPF
jgi:apolipoprotein N-acyltransferase